MSLPEPASPLNALSELQILRQPPATLSLNDVTLREGEQSAHVAFSLGQKLELARALEEAGIRQVQVGYPGRFPRDAEAVRVLSEALEHARVEAVALAFVSDWEREVEACVASGAGVVNVVYRASDRLHALLGVSREHALRRTEEAVARAAAGGLTVAFTPSDSTRADPDFLAEMWKVAAEAGAQRIYIADSVGAATPELIAFLVKRARAATGVAVGVHCHNDFGLVVANTIAGVMAGAQFADVAVNGLGDRAGNAPLEEVAAALALLYGLGTGIDLKSLTSLSGRFAEASGRHLHPNKPITGPAVFTHTLPTHVRAIEADNRSIQPFEPEAVGNVQRVALRPER